MKRFLHQMFCELQYSLCSILNICMFATQTQVGSVCPSTVYSLHKFLGSNICLLSRANDGSSGVVLQCTIFFGCFVTSTDGTNARGCKQSSTEPELRISFLPTQPNHIGALHPSILKQPRNVLLKLTKFEQLSHKTIVNRVDFMWKCSFIHPVSRHRT